MLFGVRTIRNTQLYCVGSSYLTVNMLRLRYTARPVNDVWRISRCLLSEPYGQSAGTLCPEGIVPLWNAATLYPTIRRYEHIRDYEECNLVGVPPCGSVQVHLRSGGKWCVLTSCRFHASHISDPGDGGSALLRNIGRLPRDYMASHPIRLQLLLSVHIKMRPNDVRLALLQV
jgi:hypothetical protein